MLDEHTERTACEWGGIGPEMNVPAAEESSNRIIDSIRERSLDVLQPFIDALTDIRDIQKVTGLSQEAQLEHVIRIAREALLK